MNIVKAHVCASAALFCMAAAPMSEAVECRGYTITQFEKPIELRKTKDGSTVNWLSNQRINIVVAPEGAVGNRSTGVCGGGWTIAADGVSGQGQGFCSYVDADGDMWHITYEGSYVSGTWEIVGGTGKFADYAGKGTWKPVGKYRFTNGLGSNEWEGECSM